MSAFRTVECMRERLRTMECMRERLSHDGVARMSVAAGGERACSR